MNFAIPIPHYSLPITRYSLLIPQFMTIANALKFGWEKLKKAGLKTVALDAEVLLSFVLKKSKEFLYTYPEKKLFAWQILKFKKLLNRRAKFEPVAYLTNHKEFYGLDFYIDKNVLIPRPETEMLMEEIINYFKYLKTGKNLTIADIGTGSGCIIIALAKTLSTICDWRFAISYYATDISQAALKIAKLNAQRHGVKIKFLAGNLLTPLKSKKTCPEFCRRIDILVANLPYLSKNFKKQLNLKDYRPLKYEPKIAWWAGQEGMDLYKKFFRQLKKLKLKPQIIFLEISAKQVTKLKKLIKSYSPSAKIIIIKNFSNLIRVAIVKL